MSNYNSQLQSNNIDLQTVLQTLQTKAAGSREVSSWSENEDAIINRSIRSDYTNDRVIRVGNCAFAFCSSITSVKFPVCKNIESNAFNNCVSLTSISFPACTSIGDSAFMHCNELTSVSFPNCISIAGSAFADCYNLRTASFQAVETINYGAFSKCYRLSTLYLLASTICTLRHSSIFNSTPYAGYSAAFSGTPYIYVPSSLVDAYRTATNWAYFSSYIDYERTGHSGGLGN